MDAVIETPSAHVSAADDALTRAQAQAVLFAPSLSRLAVQQLRLPNASRQRMRVNIWRNHAIEGLWPLAQPFFDFADVAAEAHLGDYDDSLPYAGHEPADVELLWLDSTRYLEHTPFADWLQWLGERLRALRARSDAPIVLATWVRPGHAAPENLQALVDAIPAVFLADLALPCIDAGVPLLDPRSAVVAGSPLGRAAQAVLARKLACHWLPGAALPPIKALALDLDHTLHAGVLGEDGPLDVQVSAAHAALQRMLRDQRERGSFLALVSRNERADVEALFTARAADYPLRWSDFSATEVSWEPKAEALRRIAGRLRIGADTILFVDDNPGELAAVVTALPGIRTVHAAEDAAMTERAIAYYPGLWRWRIEAEDAVRARDLEANAERAALLDQAGDAAAYFQSLRIALEVRVDAPELLPRAADLCRKTNQFNLGLRRLPQAEVARRMADAASCVATVRMQDRLSDSGVAAVLVATRVAARLRIEELCVSCRAMGRQLEDTMILSAILAMPVFDGCDAVVFEVAHGPRNQPALDWLAALLGVAGHPAAGEHSLAAARVRDFEASPHVRITRETSWVTPT